MSTDEKLIEEAAKAIWNADSTLPEAWDSKNVVEWDRDTYRAMARAALAVFEKAHTPTDDEREALAQVVSDAMDAELPEDLQSGSPTSLDENVADAILAAGFRRSQVPEPSARTLTPCGNLVCTGCRVCGCPALGIPPAVAEPQGEPSDAQLLAQGFRDGVDYIDDQPGPWGAAVVAGRAEAARRVAAAGGGR